MPELVPAGFFVVRTPLLPIDAFIEWGTDLELSEVGRSTVGIEDAWRKDVDTLRRRLLRTMRRSDIREALFIASPGFEGRFDARVNDRTDKRGKSYERALVRYFARMSARATPFGLSAGCTFGKMAKPTRLKLLGRDSYRRCTRIDVDFLSDLARALVRDPSFHELGLSMNSSLCVIADRLHYVKGERSRSGHAYFPVAVEKTLLLEAVLEIVGSGTTVHELKTQLGNLMPAISKERVEALIQELIDHQILVAACAPVVTGGDPLDQFVRDLDVSARTAAVSQKLAKTRDDLKRIDATLGVDPADYRAIARDLDGLPAKPDRARLFQADLVKPADEVTVGEEVTKEITQCVDWLHRWFGPGSEDPLDAFRAAFRDRYGEREVPLVEALDEEVGIGGRAFGGAAGSSPLLEDMPVGGHEPRAPTWDVRQDILLRRLGRALEEGSHEIQMRPDDPELLESLGPPFPLPPSFAVKGSLSAASDEALDEGKFRFHLHGSMGPPATILLGRACQADEKLADAVRELLREEDSRIPDAIVAEIVYYPKGRLGNIQARPAFGDYEIPYLGRSGFPKDRRLRVDDLLVSVIGNTVVLRSSTLAKRVIPRMSSAHNFRRDSNTVYRFLCSLQIQGVCWWLRWDWGALKNAHFLPRVVLGRTVLSPATWSLEREEIQELAIAKNAKRFVTVQQWRSARNVPRYVFLVDSDEKLLCDFDNALSVETFVELIKNWPTAMIEELFPPGGESAVEGPEGRFLHDLIVPFRSASDSPICTSDRGPIDSSAVSRSRVPGSDWLFLKIYTGPVTADQLLCKVLRPFLAALSPNDLELWFFVRYADPELHLRLRFKAEPKYLWSELLPQLHDRLRSLMSDRKLWRVAIDTYERENERYGGSKGLLAAERIFQADSIAALDVVETCLGDTGADARWHITLLGIDHLLDDFGLQLESKARLIGDIRSSFNREFRADRQPLKHSLSERFRHERASIERLLDPTRKPDEHIAAGLSALHQRSEALKPLAGELRTYQARGELSRTIEELLPSYIHMQCNRMLRWPHRAQEMVLYDFLSRYYNSQLARSRANA